MRASQAALLSPTDRGLYCAAGDFHVDPWQPVERAIVTHAHGDHFAQGCGLYVTSAAGAPLLNARLQGAANTADPDTPQLAREQAAILRAANLVESLAYGEPRDFGPVRVSLHPAGHILGSSQVRIEHRGQVWVVSGDYKTALPGESHDRTCAPFESVACDVFITESTFGLPIYRWQPDRLIFGAINDWWRENVTAGRTSMVFAYSLGKAQRVLSGIDPSIGPIAVHGAVVRMNEIYRNSGITLPDAPHAAGEVIESIRGQGGLVVAPPSALGSPWIRKFAGRGAGMSAAFVSGWMQVRGRRRRKAVDRGFVLSDHADWPGLLSAIRATGARRVGVTHGSVGPMVRWLREGGIDAFPVPTRYTGEIGEEAAAGDKPEETAVQVTDVEGDS
jgi:putative mRNA 3-end processing factor